MEVRADTFNEKYITCQCKDLVHMEKGDYQYQDPMAGESIFYSIKSVLVNLGSNNKWRLCRIVTPTAGDIPERMIFLSH